MPGIDPAVFAFVSQIVAEVDEDEDGVEAGLSGDSTLITFVETFFDQFFGSLGHAITGFSKSAQRRAIEFVEGLGTDDEQEKRVRRIVVSFEEFCELVSDARGNYSGSSVRYSRALHLLDRLLAAVQSWVDGLPGSPSKSALLMATNQARTEIEAYV